MVTGTVNDVRNFRRSEFDEIIKSDYNKDGQLINRSVVPKGYDSIDEFKTVVGHVDDYLNESPNKDQEDNPIVVFWEHENAGDKDMMMRGEGLTEVQVEERARENVFYIADTFTGFLNKLHD